MFLENLNLHLIDSGLIRKNFAGSYLISSNNEAALIEVSTAHAVPNIIKELENLNISPNIVKYIFITHIHLDHASGVGSLMKILPNAKLVLQPSGAKHMIDPEKLIQGAINVYGKEVVKRDYGKITPVERDRVIEAEDFQDFFIGDRKLTTIYTPGHARHHMSILDQETMGIFTGDSFGLSYPELDYNGKRFYQPTTTPTAFEYDKMIESIDKMMALEPRYLFFTHFGISENPKQVEKEIKKRLKDYKDLVYESEDNLEISLGEYYIAECYDYGVTMEKNNILNLFDIDIKLNAMGLKIWKNRCK